MSISNVCRSEENINKSEGVLRFFAFGPSALTD